MRKAVLFIGLAVSLVLAACGGKQPDPVDLITSAAEESSAVETTAEETAAEAESIVAEMPFRVWIIFVERQLLDERQERLVRHLLRVHRREILRHGVEGGGQLPGFEDIEVNEFLFADGVQQAEAVEGI